MNYFSFIKDHLRRKYILRNTTDPDIQSFLQNSFVDINADCSSIPIIALDFETTGFNSKTDHILSIGFVKIENFSIQLKQSFYSIVYSDLEIPSESAVIHKITQDSIREGININKLASVLLDAFQGSVLLAHHASMEKKFLDALFQNVYGIPFLVPIIDTERLAVEMLKIKNEPIRQNDLRLYNLRKRFSLPDYSAHNALKDALACAELFLAIYKERFEGKDVPLKRILS